MTAVALILAGVCVVVGVLGVLQAARSDSLHEDALRAAGYTDQDIARMQRERAMSTKPLTLTTHYHAPSTHH